MNCPRCGSEGWDNFKLRYETKTYRTRRDIHRIGSYCVTCGHTRILRLGVIIDEILNNAELKQRIKPPRPWRRRSL